MITCRFPLGIAFLARLRMLYVGLCSVWLCSSCLGRGVDDTLWLVVNFQERRPELVTHLATRLTRACTRFLCSELTPNITNLDDLCFAYVIATTGGHLHFKRAGCCLEPLRRTPRCVFSKAKGEGEVLYAHMSCMSYYF